MNNPHAWASLAQFAAASGFAYSTPTSTPDDAAINARRIELCDHIIGLPSDPLNGKGTITLAEAQVHAQTCKAEFGG